MFLLTSVAVLTITGFILFSAYRRRPTRRAKPDLNFRFDEELIDFTPDSPYTYPFSNRDDNP